MPLCAVWCSVNAQQLQKSDTVYNANAKRDNVGETPCCKADIAQLLSCITNYRMPA